MPLKERKLRDRLAAAGWEMHRRFDYCWMACDGDGYVKVTAFREGGQVKQVGICLCEQHALMYEMGAAPDDGRGWPWTAAENVRNPI